MFYIYNAYGNIDGNPKGYKTHKGAQRWAESKKMQLRLWGVYYQYKTRFPKATLVYSIRWSDK